MPKSPILGAFSKARSANLADSEIVNLFLEIVETKDGKTPGALYNTAGLDLVGTLGSGPIRGVCALNDVLYVVSGPTVYSLTANGIATVCGSIGSGSSPVSMFQNTLQLMIANGIAAWIVPGGYPLTGGTINDGGGLYAVNDTITLKDATGTQSSYPIVTVTGVTNMPATSIQMVNAGSTYTTNMAATTSLIQPQPGTGSGLTLNITASSGVITAASINAAGAGYAVADTGLITAGSYDAYYIVTAISGGAVTGIRIIRPGTIYATAAAVPTEAAASASSASGIGLTLSITAAGGPVTSATVKSGGQNYLVGNAGYITTGSGDASFEVTGIGANGAVTSFTITQAGSAIEASIASLAQKSTSGSGSGFALSSPTCGAFVGLIQVPMPFPGPVMGGISDGFGLMIFQASQNIAQSDELDLSTWGALNYGVSDQSPDNCVSLSVIHDEAYILKQQATEVWTDAGTAGFSFAPLQGVHMEFGCAAPFSVVKAGERLLWLSRNSQGQGEVVMATGYQVRIISTQALTAEFDGYANIGDAIAYSFQQGGHTFYVLTFPEADKTWFYDMTASEMAGVSIWGRMAAWLDGQWHRHWGNCFVPWTGSVRLVTQVETYQANGVTITNPTLLKTASAPVGLPPSFSTAVMSVWLLIPDGSSSGMVFSNQTDDTHGTTNPGLFVQVTNDATGTPEITIEAWDTSNAAIVSATYTFATWSGWVNLLISIDTATQVLQVYANVVTGHVLAETELAATSITWSSSNPIAPPASQAWHVDAAL